MKKSIKIACFFMALLLVVPMLFSCSILDTLQSKKSIVNNRMTEEQKAEKFINAQNSESEDDLYVNSKAEMLMKMSVIVGEVENVTEFKSTLTTLSPKNKDDFQYSEVSEIKEDGEDDYKFESSEILTGGKLYIKNGENAFISNMTAKDYIKYNFDNSTDESIDHFTSVSCTQDKKTKQYTVKLSNPIESYKSEIIDEMRGSLEEMGHFLNVKKYDITLVVTPLGDCISLKEKMEFEGKAGTSYSSIKVKVDAQVKALEIGENEKINSPQDADKYIEVPNALVVEKISTMKNEILNIKGGKLKGTYNLSVTAPYSYTLKQEFEYDFKMIKNGNVEFIQKLKQDGVNYNFEYKNGEFKNKNASQILDVSQEEAYVELFGILNLCKINATDFSTIQFKDGEYICTIDVESAEEYITALVNKSFEDPMKINKIEMKTQKIHLFFNEKGELVKAQKNIKVFINNSFTISEDQTVEYTPVTKEYYPSNNT